MPKKASAKKVPISIQRVNEQRLIDSELLKATEEKKERESHLVAWSAFLGFVAGGLILIYFLSSQGPAEEET